MILPTPMINIMHDCVSDDLECGGEGERIMVGSNGLDHYAS